VPEPWCPVVPEPWCPLVPVTSKSERRPNYTRRGRMHMSSLVRIFSYLPGGRAQKTLLRPPPAHTHPTYHNACSYVTKGSSHSKGPKTNKFMSFEKSGGFLG
jgi:hypothetical protein